MGASPISRHENERYFAWLADGNDAVSWMCI